MRDGYCSVARTGTPVRRAVRIKNSDLSRTLSASKIPFKKLGWRSITTTTLVVELRVTDGTDELCVKSARLVGSTIRADGRQVPWLNPRRNLDDSICNGAERLGDWRGCRRPNPD